MIRKWLLSLLVFLALGGPLHAQTEAEPTITLPATTVTLSQVFEQLRKAGYTLSYGNNIDLDQKVSYTQRSLKLKALLKETGKAAGLGFRQKDKKLIVYRKPTAQVDPDAPKVTLSGYIRDAANGEELIGATVYLNELAIGTTSNIYGFYSITVPAGSYTVSYRFIGYQTQEKPMDLTTATTFNIELPGSKTALQEVEITAEKDDEALTEVQMSMERLDIKTVEEIPQFLGETDIIRSVLMLPGVATVGEGTSGFNVRGGAVDQNLILLDEASVYNSSHVFGFFSVFNSDAIKGLELYKGGIPARYGGRLSSVMDVRQKEGNSKGFSGRGGISVLSSRLTVEGPLKKGKSSFMVSGRRSYGDLFLKLSPSLRDNTAYFYDLNLKVNHKFDDKNRLFLSGYFGRDVWKFGEDFASDWGNSTATVRWNHLFNDRLFSNFTYVFSNFTYSLGVPTGSDAFDWDSKIVNHNLKADFSYFPSPRHTIEFGLNTMFYRFTPGDVRGIGEGSIFNDISIAREHALRPALYASDEFRVNERLTLQAGLRLSLFMNMG
ncbi:MAG: TonB-dependent receptor, partial [Bacteroidota bacterium]